MSLVRVIWSLAAHIGGDRGHWSAFGPFTRLDVGVHPIYRQTSPRAVFQYETIRILRSIGGHYDRLTWKSVCCSQHVGDA